MQGKIIVGIGAGFASVVIGVGWQIATRAGVTSSLEPTDLALLRYGVPTLILAPIWLRAGLLPAGVSRLLLFFMVLGAGACFGLVGMAGAQFAPAAHMGALLPATMPVFVGVMAWVFLKESLSKARLMGFVLVAIGVAAIALPALSLGSGAWRGDLLFLGASMLWSIYTVAYRKSGLSPWVSSAVISAWSFPIALIAWLVLGSGKLLTAPLPDIALQFLWQGLLAGVGGLATFALAVRNLGAGAAAAFGALVPVAAALAGWAILGERLEPWVVFGVIVTSCGVALVALNRFQLPGLRYNL
ncbi:DMT family transporter [Lacibacterium aquatile]|uniref:DMT family transporter n=1 Tax=Lacibacterium aquatile TaxID=1168082 RepID=A0ABW5DQT8_9PROT